MISSYDLLLHFAIKSFKRMSIPTVHWENRIQQEHMKWTACLHTALLWKLRSVGDAMFAVGAEYIPLHISDSLMDATSVATLNAKLERLFSHLYPPHPSDTTCGGLRMALYRHLPYVLRWTKFIRKIIDHTETSKNFLITSERNITYCVKECYDETTNGNFLKVIYKIRLSYMK
jgi:hypothetical protein